MTSVAALDLAPLGAALEAAVGAAHVTRRAAGLLVVEPGSAEEAAAALGAARAGGARLRIGGGRWPADPDGRPRVALRTGRLGELLELDETSLLVHAQAGLPAAALEARLAARRLTLGPLAARCGASTLGALLARRRPELASPRGRLHDQVVTATFVLPDGRLARGRAAPRRSVGPDPARLLLGSEGRLALFTSAVLRVERAPEAVLPAAARFAALDDALSAIGELLAAEVRPSALRVRLAASGRRPAATLELRLEGARALVAAEQAIAAPLLEARGGRVLPPPVLEPLSTTPVALARPTGLAAAARAVRAVLARAPGGAGARALVLDAFCDDGALVGLTGAVSPSELTALRRAAAAAGAHPIGGDGAWELPELGAALANALDPSALLGPSAPLGPSGLLGGP